MFLQANHEPTIPSTNLADEVYTNKTQTSHLQGTFREQTEFRALGVLKANRCWPKRKLDGVGPVDNRPSTDKFQQIVRFFFIILFTCDMWHMPFDTWHTGGGEHCLKISAP